MITDYIAAKNAGTINDAQFEIDKDNKIKITFKKYNEWNGIETYEVHEMDLDDFLSEESNINEKSNAILEIKTILNIK